MDFLPPRRRTKIRTRYLSPIQIYHNQSCSLDNILDVVYPLFSPYYSLVDIVLMIYTSKHKFCAYDQQQGHTVACALLKEVNGKTGLYIKLFGVRQSDQGRGTGTYVLQQIIQWAHANGYASIELHVHGENYPAIRLYEKVGFRKSEYLPNYFSGTRKRTPHGYRMILLLQ